MTRTFTSPARPEPVDRDPSRRPGVPMIGRATSPTGVMTQQQPTVPVLVGVEVGQLTPVFGTTVPLRGLSGLIRRAAYRIPEHKAARWLLLMIGDRVDVMEGRVQRHPFVATLLLGGLVALFARRRVAAPA